MTHTKNYNLTQWSPDDRILRENFNADNAAIDTALAAHDAALALRGNCRIETFTFAGTSTQGQNITFTLKFSARPLLFLIFGANTLYFSSTDFHMYLGNKHSSVSNSFVLQDTEFEWVGNTAKISLSAEYNQMNITGRTYQVVALYAEDEK